MLQIINKASSIRAHVGSEPTTLSSDEGRRRALIAESAEFNQRRFATSRVATALREMERRTRRFAVGNGTVSARGGARGLFDAHLSGSRRV